MNIHRMLCFGRNDESGNAAIVVEDSALAEPERMKFAQRQDASATVFVEADAAGDMQLDYYSRMPAALFVCMRRLRRARFSSSGTRTSVAFGSSRASIGRRSRSSALTRESSSA